jgi:peroxiredoxin Q/BCP
MRLARLVARSVAACAAFGASLVVTTAAAAQAPAVGEAAPAFSAAAADAEGPRAVPVTLAANAGKVVVLAFYPADRTGGCTAELTKFRDEHASLFGRDVVVLPVSADDLATHAAWAREMNFPFPLLSDPKLELAEKYGSRGAGAPYASRTVFVIGRDGRVAYRDLRFNALGESAYQSLAAAVAKARGA